MKFVIGRNGTITIPTETLKSLNLKVGDSIILDSINARSGTVRDIKSTVGQNGVVTLPKEVITKLNLSEGDYIDIPLTLIPFPRL